MKILDKAGRPVRGIAAFEYLGYEISTSTLGRLFVEVAVFKIGEPRAVAQTGTVQAAIAWVDAQPA